MAHFRFITAIIIINTYEGNNLTINGTNKLINC